MSEATALPSPPWPASAQLLDGLAQLRWLRVEFVQLPLCDLRLPEHAGHLWRSVLLMHLAARHPDLLGRLERRGPGGEAVKLWALEPPLLAGAAPAGSALAGSVVLFGEAAHFAGEVIQALSDFEQRGVGLGRDYVPLHLAQCAVTGMPGADDGHADEPLSARELLLAAAEELQDAPASGVALQMLTPTEFTVHDRCLRQAPSFAQLLHFGRRRLVQLAPADLPGGLFAPGEAEAWQAWAAAVALLHDATTLQQGQRFSRNQAHEVPLRGLLGQAAYAAPASLAWPWLRLFEHLQLGKKPTHGQGVVRFIAQGAGPAP